MWGNNVKKLIENETGRSRIKRRISGFWRRMIAFVIDGIIVTAMGKGLIVLLGDFLEKMGASSAWIEFGLFVFYFGTLNSCIGGGQTLGKRLLAIRVVNVRGRDIRFSRAVLRAAILGSFLALSAISSVIVSENGMLINLLLHLVIGTGIVYFYVFNDITRQSLHDLLTDSFVVEADAEDVTVHLVIERKHYIVYSLLVMVLLVGGMQLHSMQKENSAMNIEFLQNELKNIEGITKVSLRSR